MADPILDEINLVTRQEIMPDAIEDNFFLDTPFLAYLRARALVPFPGGAFTQTVFMYAPLIGGAYGKGANFNLTKPQTISGTLFDPRYYEVSIVEYLEDLEVLNKGPLAVFKLIDLDVANAYHTISAIVALAIQLNGQTAGRTTEINGWPEAMNDGIVPSWDGNIYTAYGTQARNGAVGAALNGNVFWCGQSTGAAGPITYNLLEEGYQAACRGREEPDLGVGNKAVIAYIKERMQPQQRYGQERDPYFGASTFRFNNARILKDDYFPSLKYGKNEPLLGNYLTGTFTSPNVAGLPNNFPQNVTLTVGEVFNFYNTKKWMLRVSDSREYGFGVTDFVRAQDNTRVAAQLKAAVNLECTAPWANVQMYGING